MAARRQPVSLFQSTEVFRITPDEVLSGLIERCELLMYGAGEEIIRKGEAGDAMFVLASGSVKIHSGELVVATMGAGEFFGEIALLDEGVRSMTVTALESSQVYRISREIFYEVLNQHPEVLQRIIVVLTKRLRAQNDIYIRQLLGREEELRKLVDEQTRDLLRKNEELSALVQKLQETQQQLIRSEKMASLVQLTAYIAHEIQNPLNFITNFSQFAVELLDELEQHPLPGDSRKVTEELRENLTRIFQYGLRADAIVKNMIEHTRTTKGVKQWIDVNLVCEEVLNVFYRSMTGSREMLPVPEKNFDPAIPKLLLVPQDISRAMLNILNNAFHSAIEAADLRKDAEPARVGIETELKIDTVEIRVWDNGMGIDPGIAEKIFEPFFTTKPSGQAGLGLSLAADVIQAHGGKICAANREEGGAVFILTLPVQESEA